MAKSDRVRLQHMLEAAEEAISFLDKRQRIDLDTDRMLCLSLVKLIEIIGEAASKISSDTQTCYPQIPWPDIIGMGHRLIHSYDDVDLDILWQVVKEDLPPLIGELAKIVKNRK